MGRKRDSAHTWSDEMDTALFNRTDVLAALDRRRPPAAPKPAPGQVETLELAGADLDDADLDDLDDADLDDADLDDADLDDADLDDADLDDADLDDAELVVASLADLAGADLASLSDDVLEVADADLSEADFREPAVEEIVERITKDRAGAAPLDAALFVAESDPALDVRVLAHDEDEFMAALPPAARAVLEAARKPTKRWPDGPRIAFAVAKPL